jgi:L-methionine (R)-S-oxide reductase
MSESTTAQAWLEQFVADNGGCAGSVHYRSGEVLLLAASVNLPEIVRKITATVPRGKGMAGIALDEDRAVTTCNLKTDDSGQVKPGARAVDAQAAAALPVRNPDGAIRAVVGIAFVREGEIADDEMARLAASAATLPIA